jgi:hypothetical protein
MNGAIRLLENDWHLSSKFIVTQLLNQTKFL